MRAATCVPATNSPPGAASTVPTASIPGTREKLPRWPIPRRKCNSDRCSPNASTRIKTSLGPGTGTGTSRVTATSTGRLMLHLLATLAEYERELIVERVHAASTQHAISTAPEEIGIRL
jgi:hypothetical protein